MGRDEKVIEFTCEELGSKYNLDIEADCKCSHEYGDPYPQTKYEPKFLGYYEFLVENVHTRSVYNYQTKKVKLRNKHPKWFAILDKLICERLNKNPSIINREFRTAIKFNNQDYFDIF